MLSPFYGLFSWKCGCCLTVLRRSRGSDRPQKAVFLAVDNIPPPEHSSNVMSSTPTLKRPSSSLEPFDDESSAKRLKRIHYHHHHRLSRPVVPIQSEPAIADDSCVDFYMNRIVGQSLRDAGFDLSDPVALDSFRNATEECTLVIPFTMHGFTVATN